MTKTFNILAVACTVLLAVPSQSLRANLTSWADCIGSRILSLGMTRSPKAEGEVTVLMVRLHIVDSFWLV